MAFSLELPNDLRQTGWKVKIRDKERLEPPHVTILLKSSAWRLNLRTGGFLEPEANWRSVDPRVRGAIEDAWSLLCSKWDAMYPDNPVGDLA
jgi:hypothetical protein